MSSQSSASYGYFDAFHDVEQLCDLCQHLVLAARNLDIKNNYNNPLTFPHHRTAEALVESAQACPFCRVFAGTTPLMRYTSGSLPRRDEEWHEKNSIGLVLRLQVDLVHGSASTAEPKIRCLAAKDGCDMRYDVFGGVSHINIGVQDAARFSHWRHDRLEYTCGQIREWLNTCRSGHDSCNGGVVWDAEKRAVRPRRVLDIGGDGAAVVETEGLSREGFTYCTLSHCWGDQTNLPKLTRLTENLYAKHVPESVLTRTFHDAIAVTRAVGFRYLWIDSLCIMQDSAEDWQEESAKMAAIYALGALQLAVASETDNNVGMNLASPVQSLPTQRYYGSVPANEPHQTTHRLVGTIYSEETERNRARSSIIDSHLNNRGWVLQETQLAPRTISFTDEFAYWECLERVRSVQGLLDENTFISQGTAATTITMKQDSWYRLTIEYSKRKFTFAKDRAAALAGLIQRYEASREDECILGLWRKSIHSDLAWRNNTECPLIRVNELADLPLWSWLSLNNAFHHDPESNGFVDALVTINSVSMEWSGPRYTSRLISAELNVTGPTENLRAPILAHVMTTLLEADIRSTCLHFKNFLFWPDMPLARQDLEQLRVLGLHTYKMSEFCLVLRPGTNSTGTVYQRVGVLRYDHSIGNTLNSKAFRIASLPMQMLSLG